MYCTLSQLLKLCKCNTVLQCYIFELKQKNVSQRNILYDCIKIVERDLQKNLPKKYIF